MRSKTAFVVVSSCLWYVAACGQQGSEQPEQMPSAETVVPDIPGVVAQATEIQVFEITSPGSSEGPVPLPDGSVVFAERAANRVWQIDTDDNVSLFVENTSGAMGMGLDPEGRLIVGQTLPPERPTIGVIYPEDQKAVLADTCDGRPLTRPNDLVVGRDGGVYFTDPGPTDAEIADGWVRRDPMVCYIPPGDSEAIQVADGIERPNGIQLSPDEKTLYVNNSYGEYLLAFDVEPDGTLSNRRDFGRYELLQEAEAGAGPVQVSDGLAVDDAGRLYVINQSVTGVQVFSPQGESLGTIPLPRNGQNLTFGGPDKKTLYVVGGGYAQKIQMLAQGIQGRAK